MQGQLFSQDFLLRGIRDTPPYQELSAESFAAFRIALKAIYGPTSTASVVNEASTEQDLIAPVLIQLGWGADTLPQQNLSGRRREDVPDTLLFASADAKALAQVEPQEARRYRHGIAILEAKKWGRPLDRGDPAEALDPDAPSSQMLRYLSRAEVVSDRAIKSGLLTNGGLWRLYWQDARSRAEEFFEVDVAAALGVAGTVREPGEADADEALKLFSLLFHRGAFLPHRDLSREARRAGDDAVDLGLVAVAVGRLNLMDEAVFEQAFVDAAQVRNR